MCHSGWENRNPVAMEGNAQGIRALRPMDSRSRIGVRASSAGMTERTDVERIRPGRNSVDIILITSIMISTEQLLPRHEADGGPRI
jgi:hypothetical protein